MQKRIRCGRILTGWLLSLALAVGLAGCGGGGGGGALAPFTEPPAPVQGAAATQLFHVNTLNYFTLYGTPLFNDASKTASYPFDPSSQFANGHYPITVNNQTVVAGPAGFDLSTETGGAIRVWYAADPRVRIANDVVSGAERIKVKLVDSITYQGIQNILGLTMLMSGGSNPYYLVSIAVNDPITHQPLPAADLDKTITHELGHVFGLGHSPDPRDLMYYQSNALQGQTPRYFLTFGDAMAMWSTLNNRRINYTCGDAVTFIQQAFTARGTTSTEPTGPGQVVCIYTKP